MEEKESYILVQTSMGDIKIQLYNDTPHHRDNILKLAKEGFYNGTLFHRVIKEFMIQGGDPDSKNAAAGQNLGAGDAGYTLPAEFVPTHFHKRGALAAARLGDNVNPNKDSSGCQFYIVTGKLYKPAELRKMEKSINMGKENNVFEQLVRQNIDKIKELRLARNQKGLMKLQDELIEEAKKIVAQGEPFKFTPEQEEAYTTVGGTPFLDNEYTVYGEVVDGFDVVEAIEKVKTNRSDRPNEDITMNISVL
jgi:peptidylprolyl isomerase